MFSKIWWSVRFAVSLHSKSSETSVFSVTISSVEMAMDFEIYAIGLVGCNWALYCTHEMR
jgi:hypothetical protein